MDRRASHPRSSIQTFIETGDNRRLFLRFYGIRGSVAYSKGAHDEWNIVEALNARRSIGEDIAGYFDGRPIEPGDFFDVVDKGNTF